ncbi:hypothetical protein [Kitasatospora phosalacinea]|uniref:Uncharacterized protein n=1 Tax=Kitasatospora phosalacinea TaxID=2065 RepID=A0A9W6PEF1_9ACTN|nr:hypothetical protein [Kitasatospora phosalacinea]GLW53586.1 hypothetical protein Kpho01_15970 [Kitasatospora phosalacinea]
MIIEGKRPGGASWWGVVAERARACGWQLLAVVAVSAAVEVTVEVATYAVPQDDAVRVVRIVLLVLLSACEYGPAMRLLAFGPRSAAVLRVPPRQLGLMALWSALLSVSVLSELLLVFSPEAAFDLYRGPQWPAVVILALLGGAVAAPLPAAVFLEGGGLRASWRLLRGGWPTALRLCAVALCGAVAELLVQELYVDVFFASGSPFLALVTRALVVPLHFALLLALFATYLRSPAARPAVPLDGPPAEQSSAYPPVDAAFGR